MYIGSQLMDNTHTHTHTHVVFNVTDETYIRIGSSLMDKKYK